MAALTPESANEFLEACEAGAEEAAGALGRSLDGEFKLTVGKSTRYSPGSPPEGFDGPGLAMSMTFGGEGVVVLLPDESGLVPDWCAAPDATGESKLSTLAQELSMLLVPESLMADEFAIGHVDTIATSLAAVAPADAAVLITLALASGDRSGTMSMIWPVGQPGDLLPKAAEPPAAEPAAMKTPTSPPASAEVASNGGDGPATDLNGLPTYTRSLLKIEVPVTVRLATKRETVRNIVDLVPGSIVKFDKSCDDLLELTVGDRAIATGEAVKVGDKFGLRIHEILLPKEHFAAVRPAKAG
jgi:flagellar motor switch protein FliN